VQTSKFNALLFPLGAITGAFTMLALITAWPWAKRSSGRRRFYLGIAAMAWLTIFLLNPLFYDEANRLLATPGALNDAQVTSLLEKWISAQWIRVVVSCIGLLAAVAGLTCTVAERTVARLREA
jgi:hypothetical protein